MATTCAAAARVEPAAARVLLVSCGLLGLRGLRLRCAIALREVAIIHRGGVVGAVSGQRSCDAFKLAAAIDGGGMVHDGAAGVALAGPDRVVGDDVRVRSGRGQLGGEYLILRESRAGEACA